jgi:hypothetical protein
MHFDCWSRQVQLEGDQEVFLRKGTNEIHARNLTYTPAPGQGIGEVAAEGPGWLRGAMAGRADQPLAARWNGMLDLRPHEQQQVVSLTGGAQLNFGAVGELTAQKIYFWFWETANKGTPGGGGPAGIKPDRLLAKQDVRLQSAQVSGAVDEMQLWFESVEARPPAGVAGTVMSGLANANRATELARLSGAPMTAGGGLGAMAEQGWRASPGAPPSTLLAGQTPAPPGAAETPSEGESPGSARHFQFEGHLIQARVGLAGMRSELLELILSGDARLAEAAGVQAGERPLVIAGQEIHVIDGSKPSTMVYVLGRGQPAHVQARELDLTADNINLNRGTNLLWIEGPGHMNLVVNRDLQGRPLARPGLLDVGWRDRMAFDGGTARFEQSVTAVWQEHVLKTRTLDVVFRTPVNFNDVRPGAKPEPQKVFCRNGVTVDSSASGPRGPISREHLETNDLAIDLDTGAAHASGPGWMSSVRRGKPGDLMEPGTRGPGGERAAPGRPPGTAGGRAAALAEPVAPWAEPVAPWPGPVACRAARLPVPGGAAAGAPAESASPHPDDRLIYLLVRFRGSISGNYKSRQTTFHDRVRAVYGPVGNWEASLDPDRPESLDAQAVAMNCDQLSIVEMPAPVGNRRAIELAAQGNAVAENRTFTARSARMTYDEGKGLLILEGDGRGDAELFRQLYVGGPRDQLSGRKIYYWPRDGHASIDGARSFESGPVKDNRGPGKRN